MKVSTKRAAVKPRGKTKAERDREEKLNTKFALRDAALKRAEAKLTRAFNAWVRARSQLASIIRAIEKPYEPPLGKGPGVAEIMDDAHKLGIL